MTTLYMEKVRNLCLPEFMCAVDAEALKDLELAADAAAAHATLTQPLAGAKAVKSGDQSDTVTPRPLVELRKLMGADGLKNLLRTGDTMDFSEAALRVAEVNAVQKRWSVSVLSGDVRNRSLEHKCPFFACKRATAAAEDVDVDGEDVPEAEPMAQAEPVTEAEPMAGVQPMAAAEPRAEVEPVAEAEAEVEAEGVTNAEARNRLEKTKTKHALPGSKIARMTGSNTPCAFHVRISVLRGARALQRVKHYDLTGGDDEVVMAPKRELDEVSELSTTAPTDISATGIRKSVWDGASWRAKYLPPAPKGKQNEAVVEFAHLQHTCQPSSLRLEGKNYVREDGEKKAKKYHPYEAKDLKPIVERVILNRDIDLGATVGKAALEACYQELSKYVECERTKLREIAGKLANDCLRAQKVEADTAPLFAQAYAAELRELGHIAGVHIKSAQEAWAQKRRVALAKHAGQQRRLGTNAPFKEDEFRRSHPVPGADSPNVLVGCKGTPSYMKLAPVGTFQNIWYKDVGGGRRRSPFQLFHMGTLDGNHHCHPIQDHLFADSESKQGWTPLLESALEAFPAMNATGARVVKDDHKGSHAACIAVMPNAVPFTDSVHRRRCTLHSHKFVQAYRMTYI